MKQRRNESGSVSLPGKESKEGGDPVEYDELDELGIVNDEDEVFENKPPLPGSTFTSFPKTDKERHSQRNNRKVNFSEKKEIIEEDTEENENISTTQDDEEMIEKKSKGYETIAVTASLLLGISTQGLFSVQGTDVEEEFDTYVTVAYYTWLVAVLCFTLVVAIYTFHLYMMTRIHDEKERRFFLRETFCYRVHAMTLFMVGVPCVLVATGCQLVDHFKLRWRRQHFIATHVIVSTFLCVLLHATFQFFYVSAFARFRQYIYNHVFCIPCRWCLSCASFVCDKEVNFDDDHDGERNKRKEIMTIPEIKSFTRNE